jgi:hypothetical protein
VSLEEKEAMNAGSRHRRSPLAWALTLLAPLTVVATSSTAEAKPNKRGGQIEGMIGAAGCIPGRAPCRHDEAVFSGGARPSFATGAALAWRPVKFFMLGAIYRWGMFNPAFDGDDGTDYRWAGQHTIGFLMRPILPIGRVDIGLNFAPAFGRQVFKIGRGNDRDMSQGFALLVGPNVDVFLTDHFFIGGGVDFIFNTQKRVCSTRGDETDCTTRPIRDVAPTHQVLFGFRLGGTFGGD